MQDEVERNVGLWHVQDVTRQLFRARWAILFSLLFAGCGGEGNETSHIVSSSTLVATSQQAARKPDRTSAQNTPLSKGAKSPEGETDDPAVRLLESPSLGQISALPHLSALSAREKAGLLVQLPGKSASERLTLINMYPSLAQLPIQQKEVLLANLEKIVPSTTSKSR